jgi:arachidonate 15-lipoxygenase
MRLGSFAKNPQSDYRFNYTHVGSLAMADHVPAQEKPSLSWHLKTVWISLRIAQNRLARIARRPASMDPRAISFDADDDAGVPDQNASLRLEHLELEQVDLGELPLDIVNFAAVEKEAHEESNPEAAVSFDESSGAAQTLAQVTKIAGRLMALGIHNPLKILEAVLKGTQVAVHGRPAAPNEYRNLFSTIEVPWTADHFMEDSTFAWMRVAGWNPMVLRGVSSLDASFPVHDEQLQRGLSDPHDNLELAGREGRLFLTDYAVLSKVKHGNYPAGPKYSFAPKALFALPRGSGPRLLRPIAIQCGQDPLAYPIFTPADGDAWQKAKTIVNIADTTHHETTSHLGHTHLLLDPFVVSTHRHFPDKHPLSELLRPHFEGTLAINYAAHQELIADGREVDMSFGGLIQDVRAVAVQSLAQPFFNEGALPNDLASRGVTSPELQYPYRDDALLLWGAIERWVSAYVRLNYADDAQVCGDEALQAWAQELRAETGGRVKGFGENESGRIETLKYLVSALTRIIFTASAEHAAVNSPQAGLMTFTPAAPCAGYRAAPVSVDDAGSSPLIDMFAPLELANLQMEFLTLLGGVVHTNLGQYAANWFTDKRVAEPLRAFQDELAQIENTIKKRNQTRFGPYPFLLPSQVPQSINI